MRTPTTEEFIDVLKNASLTALQRTAIITVFSFSEHKASAPQLTTLLGGQKHQLANTAFGGAGHKISDYLGIKPPAQTKNETCWWSIISTWDPTDRTWTLLPELIEAIKKTQFEEESLLITQADEVPSNMVLKEGSSTTITVTLYERSSIARKRCIDHHGCSCVICGFSFEDIYGETGKNYIHVHHLIPLAHINEEYMVDPLKDLIPVCPNCHAMLHRETPPLSIEELKGKMISNQRVDLTR